MIDYHRLFILLLFFAIVVPEVGTAQYTCLGRTSDLATGNPIRSVAILNKRTGTTVTSDQNGAFLLYFDSVEKRPGFQIVFNMFISSTDENVSLQLFTTDGKQLLNSGTIGTGESYLLPQLNPGIYILQVLSETKKEVVKILSTGNEISLLQSLKSQKNAQTNDTLLFSKEGYYSRQVVVPRNDTILQVKLMAEIGNDVNFLNGLPGYNAFYLLQNSPFVTNQGEVESVKFIYDQRRKLVYYMNSKRFNFHYYFAEQFMGYNKGLYHFNMTQYTNSKERYLFPGEINHYKATGKYVLRFYPGDEIQCSEIREVMEKLYDSSFLEGNLFLYPNNQEWEKCGNVPLISSEELYEGQNYQALNLAEGFGYLRKVAVDELATTYLGKHDIIILNGIPNDVSVVAGIITTEFQTPLSHINILSHNRRTPNMALRDGWTNSKFNSLIGELVYLKVEADSFTIRKAMPEEATEFWNKNEPQKIRVLEKDDTTSGLIDLSAANYSSVNLIGGKAANFAELLKLNNPKIPTPENPFAIPFYYYVQHLKTNHIQPFIDEMLADETFKTNQEYRKAKLEELQNKITSADINTNVVELVRNKIGNFSDFGAYRFRSSTNAEDLEDFSGAGLYDSYSAKKDDENKSIENAIKKVWASLWNFRAFEEREYYKIDHLSTVMGILVHRSFPGEDANGVVITKNLYNVNPGFIVNAQFDEYSIVFPEPGIMHDQIILYTYSISNTNNFTIEYLSHSNIEEFNGRNVLTNDELYLLGAYCMQIKQHFFYKVPHHCNCLFDDFGLDIEFKINSTGGKRKLYIKQIRLYN